MSLTYATFTTSLANMIVVPVNDPNYVIALPNIIADAELRLYRELDLLYTVTADSSGALTVGNRFYLLPTPAGGNGPFVVVDDVNVITPAGATAEVGTRNSLTPMSYAAITNLYPSSAGADVPQFFCRGTENVILVGPWPNAAYVIEIVGTIRPAPLSASNQTTFLSTYLPDLFLTASLIFAAGYQLNFSSAGDNPQSGQTWQSHYDKLLASASVEELRKKFGSEGWSSKIPDPIATPPRT